jgi:formyl-CoA transferase
LNRNKKSLGLDIMTDPGREVLRRLCSHADVLIENFRPGQTENWGWGFGALQEVNPGLVYYSITGFGPVGPYRDRPGYDTTGVALSGLMSLMTDIRDPQLLGLTMADLLTGIYAAYGILGALVSRERTGRGQMVETSLLRSCMAFLGGVASEYFEFGVPPKFPEARAASAACALVAGDGKPFAIHLSNAPKFWDNLVRALERPDLATDPRFITALDRRQHFAELTDLLRTIAKSRPRSEWLDTLIAADVPCAPINTVEEAFADPQVIAIQMRQTLSHPARGEYDLVAPGVTMNETWVDPFQSAPLLAEHTEEILREAGYTDPEIEELHAAGIISFNEETAATSAARD